MLHDLGFVDGQDVVAVAGMQLERSHPAEIALLPAAWVTVVVGARLGGVPWHMVLVQLIAGLVCAMAFAAAALLRRPAVRPLDAEAVALPPPVQVGVRSLPGRAVMLIPLCGLVAWGTSGDLLWLPFVVLAVGAAQWALQIAGLRLERRLGAVLFVKEGTSRPFYRLTGGAPPR